MLLIAQRVARRIEEFPSVLAHPGPIELACLVAMNEG